MSWLKLRRPAPAEPTVMERAHKMRVRYGQNAEQWVELGILAERDPSERRVLEQVREALADVQDW